MIGRQAGRARGGAIGAATIGSNVATGLFRSTGPLRAFQQTAPVSIGELIILLIGMTDYVRRGAEDRLV
ncbi:hypothetical protein B7G54_30705 [Burkholderia puraquae]|uniref:Uncharacterized protein n=1 Tax=Burkholderia puraquae TaxID=1904757 RepID=A0A1X1P8M1_9BURK|nr:hypothetical protein B7G54_30705 [Burkholderia puraquae]